MTMKPSQLATILNILALILFVWSMVPKPHDIDLIVMLTLLPCLALALKAKFPDDYGIYWMRKDPAPNISKLLIVPGVALMISTARSFQVVDQKLAFFMAAVLVSIIHLIIRKIESRVQQQVEFRKKLVLALLLIPYGYGVVVEADTRFDHYDPNIYKVAVLGKYNIPGRHSIWNLRLEPWEYADTVRNIQVPQAIYDAVKEGDKVCIHLHPGALNVKWYDVNACGAGGWSLGK